MKASTLAIVFIVFVSLLFFASKGWPLGRAFLMLFSGEDGGKRGHVLRYLAPTLFHLCLPCLVTVGTTLSWNAASPVLFSFRGFKVTISRNKNFPQSSENKTFFEIESSPSWL